jgi:NAD-dependent deacetylase
MGKLVVFSGAGLSAESGLDTFRTAGGLWSKHDINVVCNYLTWKANYEAVHRFYNMRRTEISKVEPNAAHHMIAAWQQQYETVILTQNVDDLLERAGCASVVHLHGHLTGMHCTACGQKWEIGYQTWEAADRCPRARCGSHKGVKPDVVLFNEGADKYAYLYNAINGLQTDDVVVVSGTSEIVIPIGSMLWNRPGYKIFNGLEASRNSVYDQTFLQPATEAFSLIDQVLRERLKVDN